MDRTRILIALVMMLAVACGSAERLDTDRRRDRLQKSAEPTDAQPTAESELLSTLESAGVDTDTLPKQLRESGNREFCGFDSFGQELVPITEAQRCLADRSAAEFDALYVSSRPTVEGDPIIEVYVTGKGGAVALFTDSSQDSFGSAGWTRDDGRRLMVRSDNGAAIFSLVDPVSSALDAALPEAVAEEAPAWFTDREPLAWCGTEIRLEDNDTDARMCLHDAVATGKKVEYVLGQTGDEGERGITWFRVLGAGEIELYTRHLPGAPPTDTAPPSWSRQSCSRIDFSDAEGSETYLAPASVDPRFCVDL